MSRKRLGAMLIDAGLISEQALRVALKEQQRHGGSLGRAVVELKLVSEAELVGVLAQQLKVGTIDLDAIEIPQSVLAHVTADFADLYGVVPFSQPMRFLDLAMTDPTNTTVIDELRTRTKLNIRPALAGPKMIERAIGKYYGRGFSRFYGDIPLALEDGPLLEVEKSDNEPALDDLIVEDRAPVIVPQAARPPPIPKSGASAETAALERRIVELEGRVAKQAALIEKLVTALVDHGMAERGDFR
ncbi:MAG: hypothetical protein ABI678_13200 [Kofleriaceae bacterium]